MTCVGAFSCWLHYWQDLLGAIFGGALGVVGALIVARSLMTRERRAAARMLMQDLLSVTGMVYGLTYKGRVTLETVGPDNLARRIMFYRHRLSPLFESEMAVILGSWDRTLAGLLVGFRQTYAMVDRHASQIEQGASTINSPSAQRDRDALPGALHDAYEYARAALYLLELQEMGFLGRTRERLRRRFSPDQEDKDSTALIDRLMNPAAPPASVA